MHGERKSQLGLFCGVRVEDYDSRVVLPHEFTREPAVLDRVALLDRSKAQFSPIMTLYRDVDPTLKPVYQKITAEKPVLDVKDTPDGDVTLWRVTAPQLQQQISSFFEDHPVFLGDGHHRYEAALRYRAQQEGRSINTNSAVNYMMMVLVDGADRTESEFRTLFDAAGFKLTTIIPTQSIMSIIEATPI